MSSRPVLPIDVVPGTRPPQFHWRQIVSTPIGPHSIEHAGTLPASVEEAVVSLIAIVKQQHKDLEHCKELIEELKRERATYPPSDPPKIHTPKKVK